MEDVKHKNVIEEEYKNLSDKGKRIVEMYITARQFKLKIWDNFNKV